MVVEVKKLYEDAHLPTYGTKDSACADLYAYITSDTATISRNDLIPAVIIQPHETIKIETGLAMAAPEGYYIRCYARSGLSTKHGLAPINSVPIIDNDYRGEIIIPIHNYSDMPQMISNGDRIAQMEVVPYIQTDFVEVDKLPDTERGTGGFGSSGR